VDGRSEKVVLILELADRSAAYLAMWKALESFDPKADRWAEPIAVGNQQERMATAQVTLDLLRQRHGMEEETERDILTFQQYLKTLSGQAGNFGADAAQFCRHLRDTGCSLAKQSVAQAGQATGGGD